MVVRFVGVIRVPLCARVSRVCPVCVPVPAPPGVFIVSFYYGLIKMCHKKQWAFEHSAGLNREELQVVYRLEY